MRTISLSILIAALTPALLFGCGTKGPLYIPEQRYPQKATQPAPRPATEAPATEAPAP